MTSCRFSIRFWCFRYACCFLRQGRSRPRTLLGLLSKHTRLKNFVLIWRCTTPLVKLPPRKATFFVLECSDFTTSAYFKTLLQRRAKLLQNNYKSWFYILMNNLCCSKLPHPKTRQTHWTWSCLINTSFEFLTYK